MNNDPHFFHQTDLPLDIQILNISVNLGRVGNWIDSLKKVKSENGTKAYQSKLELIQKILNQTESYLKDLENENISKRFLPTLNKFEDYFQKLKNEQQRQKNITYWAESALTWANILQHRAKLA